MAITVAADLAAGQIAMVGAARYTYEHDTLAANLFTKITLEAGEKSHSIPKFGRAVAQDLTDGIDMTDAQTLTITATAHTTDEAGCKVIITRKLRHQLKEDAYRAAGKVIGAAMSKKIDQDGLNLFSGVNSGLGTAGTTFTLGYLHAAVSQCLGQSEPVPQPMVCVLHPYQLSVIVENLALPAYNSIFVADTDMSSALRQYWRGNDKLFNVGVFASGNIAVNSASDAYGAVFSKEAFIYLVGWEPENWVEEDKSLRGWEIGIVADYKMVEEDGTYGRYLLLDASAPTS